MNISRLTTIGATFCLGVTFLALQCFFGCGPARAEGYIDSMTTALDAMEQGAANECADAIDEAFGYNANDPLAYVAYGTLLLSHGNLKDSAVYLQKARSLDPGFVETDYLLGIRSLMQRNFENSLSHFLDAASGGFGDGSAGAVEYSKSLMGNLYTAPLDANYPLDPAMTGMQALRHLKSGQCQESQKRWNQVLTGIGGYGVRPSGLFGMTFVRETPVSGVGGPLKRSSSGILSRVAKAPNVTGKVTLRADIKNAKNVMFVSFSIDGRLAGVMNSPPYEMTWDSTTAANGIHTVTIDGSDFSGLLISSKNMTISVANQGSAVSGLVRGERASELRERLKRLLLLKPASEATNYYLAYCFSKLGDAKGREQALERTLACNPRFRDARAQLSSIYKASRSRGAVPGGKTLALVIKGGPSPNTADFLDSLKKSNCKATFLLTPERIFSDNLLVKRIVEEGHTVGVLATDRGKGKDMSEQVLTKEFFTGVSLLRAMAGQGTRVFDLDTNRTGLSYPAFAHDFGLADMTQRGMLVRGETTELFVEQALRAAGKTRILLMRDDDPVAVIAAAGLVQRLQTVGYQLVGAQRALGQ